MLIKNYKNKVNKYKNIEINFEEIKNIISNDIKNMFSFDGTFTPDESSIFQSHDLPTLDEINTLITPDKFSFRVNYIDDVKEILVYYKPLNKRHLLSLKDILKLSVKAKHNKYKINFVFDELFNDCELVF